MDVQDLKFLFEVIDVKAQSKSTEDPHDANLRRFKDKWLFILTRLYEFFKNAHNINDVAKIQAKNLRNTDESRYPFAQLVDPAVKPRGFKKLRFTLISSRLAYSNTDWVGPSQKRNSGTWC